MRNIRLLFFIILFLQFKVFSADIQYVKIKPDFMYKDLSIYCKTYLLQNDLLLAMEATNLKVSRALLRKNNALPYENKLELTASEVSQIRLQETSENYVVVETLGFEARSLAWILTNTGGGEMGCRPSGPIAKISPSSFVYLFENVKNAFSNIGRFSGKLKNGDSFQAELQFQQLF